MQGFAPKEQLETPFVFCYKADAPKEQMHLVYYRIKYTLLPNCGPCDFLDILEF